MHRPMRSPGTGDAVLAQGTVEFGAVHARPGRSECLGGRLTDLVPSSTEGSARYSSLAPCASRVRAAQRPFPSYTGAAHGSERAKSARSVRVRPASNAFNATTGRAEGPKIAGVSRLSASIRASCFRMRSDGIAGPPRPKRRAGAPGAQAERQRRPKGASRCPPWGSARRESRGGGRCLDERQAALGVPAEACPCLCEQCEVNFQCL